MARRPTDDALIARLAEMNRAGLTDECVPDLRDMLRRRSSVLIARAARAVVTLQAAELTSDLITTFVRLLDSPAKADEGCIAKVALAEAMDALRLPDTEPFLRGIRHTQMEPVYGGTEDTAPGLRAQCAFALARLGGVDAMLALTALLTDPEAEARVGGVKALAHRGGLDAELLLRMKASSGDSHVDVTAECLTGLMAVEPDRSVEFVAAYLTAADEAIAEAAALALGESREPAALAALMDHRAGAIMSPGMEDAVLLAIALSRRDEAVDYLLDVTADDTPTNAARAVAALRIYAHDTAVAERVRSVVEVRDATLASDAFREYFS
ncbi:hypothetical protein HN371_26710 [Candidatus Poribacteria bacterium]|jgi:hypothetical protein|nr:hypothetical protein [Candidatus Poribacteria bacterium]MBT5533636.1 hypothetical protein [Candidatus Poribacteria bacterium]MBT5709543.1 hypothetical protein [Candidatus Poribacteria bacterium]MBT7097832.1 hypothetical protein [Candidatus Poribacteria bacterium]MBT7805946.1 hypothetical protein [Candidatus Poribacteria bacterium]